MAGGELITVVGRERRAELGWLRRHGARRLQEKTLFGLSVGDAPFAVLCSPAELPTWRAARLTARRAPPTPIYRTLEETLVGTSDRLLERDATRARTVFDELRVGGGGPRLHHRLDVGGAPVGLVMPGLDRAAPALGYLGYVGVVPHARGNGLGLLAARLAVHVLARAGAAVIVAVVDRRNRAMLRVVRALGFVAFERQVVWEAGW